MVQTQAPVTVSAWKLTEDTLHLSVGTTATALNAEQAEKLADYLTNFVASAKVSG